MHPFSAEILRRFPEIQGRVFAGDEDLPYLMAGNLADWLASIASEQLDEPLIDRVVEFHRWCAEKSEGKDAQDDTRTIEGVGFLEEVLKRDELTPLIRRLFQKEDLLRNCKYWIQWVGKGRYDGAVRSFDGA